MLTDSTYQVTACQRPQRPSDGQPCGGSIVARRRQPAPKRSPPNHPASCHDTDLQACVTDFEDPTEEWHFEDRAVEHTGTALRLEEEGISRTQVATAVHPDDFTGTQGGLHRATNDAHTNPIRTSRQGA